MATDTPIKNQASEAPFKEIRPMRSPLLQNIGLIAGREYKNQIFRRSFVIISCIYLVLVIAGSFIPTLLQLLSTRGSSQIKMAVINNAGSIAGMSGATLQHSLEAMLNGQDNSSTGDFVVTVVASAALTRTQTQVRDGDLALLLIIARNASQGLTFDYNTTTSDLTDSNTLQVQRMAEQLNIKDRAVALHLSSAEVATLFEQPSFAITNLKDEQNSRSVSEWITGLVLAYAGIILIFISNLLYGVGVAQGVAEEKGKHIMEILLLAASPFQLMVGKIIGIGLAGLTQLLALVLVGIMMFALQPPIQAALLGHSINSAGLNITNASVTMLLLVLLYFILGFTLYASLYAAAGALVQRQEEAQSAGAPISMLFAIGYITSVSLVAIPGVPDASWFKIMSYIPFWSPTMMLARIGTSTVAWWEIVLTVVLMLLVIPLCAWLSARIYRSGVLMYGQSFKSRQFRKRLRFG